MAKTSSDVGFIDLHSSVGISQLNILRFPHGFAYPVCYIPGRLLGHANVAAELAG